MNSEHEKALNEFYKKFGYDPLFIGLPKEYQESEEMTAMLLEAVEKNDSSIVTDEQWRPKGAVA